MDDINPSTTHEPRHPIQVVARRTGLSQDVIRAWERRYAAVIPQRSSSSRRLYSDRDVDRLVLLQRAIVAGRRIGDVAKFTIEELSVLVSHDDSAAAEASHVSPRPSTGYVMELFEDCLNAVNTMSASALHRTLATAAASLTTPYLIDDLLNPLVNYLIEECRAGDMRSSQERMASEVIRAFLINKTASELRNQSASRALIATPLGQNQEWPALMAAMGASAEGWESIYLGASISADELAFAAKRTSAKALLLGIAHPAEDPCLPNELRKLSAQINGQIGIVVLGAASASYHDVLKEINAQRIPSYSDLRFALKYLHNNMN